MTDEKEIIEALNKAAKISLCYSILLEDLIRTNEFKDYNEEFNKARLLARIEHVSFLNLRDKLINKKVDVKPEMKIEVKSEVTNIHCREIDLT